MAFFDPSECFLRRLNGFVSLSNEDRRLIQSLTPHAEPIPADQDIIREGDKSDKAFLISGGFACRYKLVGNGCRQIVGFFMPGDLSVAHGFALDAIDHNIATVTKAQVVTLSQRDVLTLQDRSAISRALLMMSLVNEATGRDWLANIGSRCAEQRVGHFLCEWHFRLKGVDLATDCECEFALKQSYLAEALGLSLVHVNRVLQRLRTRELIVIRSGRLIIPDVERLCAFSDFRSAYLYMRTRGQC